MLHYFKEQSIFDPSQALNSIDIPQDCVDVLDWDSISTQENIRWPTSANEGTGFALRMEHGRLFCFFVDSVELCALWTHELRQFVQNRESMLLERSRTLSAQAARVLKSGYATKLGKVRKNWKLRFLKLMSDGKHRSNVLFVIQRHRAFGVLLKSPRCGQCPRQAVLERRVCQCF